MSAQLVFNILLLYFFEMESTRTFCSLCRSVYFFGDVLFCKVELFITHTYTQMHWKFNCKDSKKILRNIFSCKNFIIKVIFSTLQSISDLYIA